MNSSHSEQSLYVEKSIAMVVVTKWLFNRQQVARNAE
jgi:hypothetical protein